MSNKELIESQWFPLHKAAYGVGDVLGEPIHKIRWAQPGTRTYRCDYLMCRGELCVTGDIGSAVYRFSDRISPLFFLDVDLDYFHSKLVASEWGGPHEAYEIDLQEGEKMLDEYFESSTEGLSGSALAERRARYSELMTGLLGSLGEHSREGWRDFLRDHEDELADVFGYDWWEFVPGVGRVPPMRIQGHLIGLQMAVRKLLDSGVLSPIRIDPEKKSS